VADGSFLRWPLANLTNEAARAAIGGTSVGEGLAMVAADWTSEAVVYSPTATIPPAPGAMHYDLDLVSDSGPVAEKPGVIMLVAFDVPPELTEEVDRWYEEEHIGLLMKADGWHRARRFRVPNFSGGPPWTSLAFHELRDASALDSPERAIARSTPWRAELEKGEWFRSAGRGLFRPLA